MLCTTFGFFGRSYVASILASIISVPKRSLPSGLTLTLISLTSPLVVAIRYSERGFFGDFLRFMTCHHAISTSDVYAVINEAPSTVVHQQHGGAVVSRSPVCW